jgi:hypothetical protein
MSVGKGIKPIESERGLIEEAKKYKSADQFQESVIKKTKMTSDDLKELNYLNDDWINLSC